MLALLFWIGCRAAEPPPPPPEPVVVRDAPDNRATTRDGRLKGICDGSAAARLRNGGLLIAYDEDAKLFVYDGLGNPQGELDLAGPLKLPEDKELDLEGAALIPGPKGPELWWVGSHGRNAAGEVAPSRRVLFATSLPIQPDASDLTVAHPAIDLLPVLTADPTVRGWLTDEVLGRGAKDGGVNIEALAASPGSGLQVGFRSPLVDGKAPLVELKRDGAGWKVASARAIDLGGGGFRDLAPHGTGWLAISGPAGDADGPSSLWEVRADGSSREVGQRAWLDGLRPEAIVRQESGWLVLSDDGKVKRPDPSAKDGDRGCDKIRAAHGAGNPQVYLRFRTIPMPEELR